jgi:hypothetical protein
VDAATIRRPLFAAWTIRYRQLPHSACSPRRKPVCGAMSSSGSCVILSRTIARRRDSSSADKNRTRALCSVLRRNRHADSSTPCHSLAPNGRSETSCPCSDCRCRLSILGVIQRSAEAQQREFRQAGCQKKPHDVMSNDGGAGDDVNAWAT